jgi:hypothetical protein
MGDQLADFVAPTETPTQAAAPTIWERKLVMLPVLAFFALIGARLPVFSRVATGYILVLGGALIWLARAHPARPRAAAGGDDRRSLAWWLLPLLAFVPMETVNYLLGSTPPHPTFSILLDPVFTIEPTRSLFYFVWLVAFWAVARR